MIDERDYRNGQPLMQRRTVLRFVMGGTAVGAAALVFPEKIGAQESVLSPEQQEQAHLCNFSDCNLHNCALSANLLNQALSLPGIGIVETDTIHVLPTSFQGAKRYGDTLYVAHSVQEFFGQTLPQRTNQEIHQITSREIEAGRIPFFDLKFDAGDTVARDLLEQHMIELCNAYTQLNVIYGSGDDWSLLHYYAERLNFFKPFLTVKSQTRFNEFKASYLPTQNGALPPGMALKHEILYERQGNASFLLDNNVDIVAFVINTVNDAVKLAKTLQRYGQLPYQPQQQVIITSDSIPLLKASAGAVS